MSFSNLISSRTSFQILSLVGVAWGLCQFSAAEAVSVRVVGGVGYGSITSEKKEGAEKDPEPITGWTASAIGEVGFFDSIPGFSLLGGAGLKYYSLSSNIDDVTSTFKPLNGLAEVGAEFSLVPMLRLQGLVSYELLLAATSEAKGTSDGKDFEAKLKVEKFEKIGLTGRALFTVAPFVSVGVAPTYTFGKLKQKVESVKFDGVEPSGVDKSSTESKFTGWDAQLVLAITL